LFGKKKVFEIWLQHDQQAKVKMKLDRLTLLHQQLQKRKETTHTHIS